MIAMRKISCTLAQVLLVVLAQMSDTSAQYRTDQPQVIERPAQKPVADTSGPTIAAFRSSYQSAGLPRIALFWNVALTDQLADDKVDRTRITRSASGSSNSLDKTTRGDAGSARLRENDEKRVSEVTIDQSTLTSNNANRGMPLPERDAFRLENAFMKTMREGAVQFIDRAAIMRTTAANAGGGGDSRTVETKALQGKAELMLEVLLTRDQDAPIGWSFRGVLRDIDSGRTLATYYSRAMPALPTLPPQYRATSRGFERVDMKHVVSIEDVGRTLALDTMAEVTGAFPAPNKGKR